MSYSPLELAVAFIQTGELEDALAAIAQHLAAQPQDDRVRRWRLTILRQLNGDSEQALTDLDQLAVPTADDFTQVALLLENSQDSNAALNLLADAHARWPQESRLTEVYLRLLLDHNHIDIALPIVRAQPPSWRWSEWEADLLVRQGNDAAAVAGYDQALALLDADFDTEAIAYLVPIKARLLLACAHAYRRLGAYHHAAQDYADAEQMMPDDPMIRFNRGLVAFLQDDSITAVTLCQTALTAANDSFRSQMLTTLQADSAYTALLAQLR